MNESKDRYGEFISLVERARQEVFFAAKDRELLDKLKHRLENAPQGQLEFHARNCPECGIALGNSSLMSFAVSRCSSCGGIWIDHAVLQQLINVKKLEPDGAYPRSNHSLKSVWPGERRQVLR